MNKYECHLCAQTYHDFRELESHVITHRRLRAKKPVPAFAANPTMHTQLGDEPTQQEIDATLASIAEALGG